MCTTGEAKCGLMGTYCMVLCTFSTVLKMLIKRFFFKKNHSFSVGSNRKGLPESTMWPLYFGDYDQVKEPVDSSLPRVQIHSKNWSQTPLPECFPISPPAPGGSQCPGAPAAWSASPSPVSASSRLSCILVSEGQTRGLGIRVGLLRSSVSF